MDRHLFLKLLLDKQAELENRLSTNPDYIELEKINSAIEDVENYIEPVPCDPDALTLVVSAHYDKFDVRGYKMKEGKG
jgi:hypothetical protein